jgi:hypothetical protein
MPGREQVRRRAGWYGGLPVMTDVPGRDPEGAASAGGRDLKGVLTVERHVDQHRSVESIVTVSFTFSVLLIRVMKRSIRTSRDFQS